MCEFSTLRSLTTVCIPLKSRSAGLFNSPKAKCYLYPCFVGVFFPTRKLANSPERHAEHTISQRLRQHHPERRQEVRLRATSGKLQKFNYVIRRVKPCRAQLKKKTKKTSPPPTPPPPASLRSLPGDWRCSGRVTSLAASQPGSESLPAL